MNFKKGFTLTEVLLCVAIVGIVSALLFPRLIFFMDKEVYGKKLSRATEIVTGGVVNILASTSDHTTNGQTRSLVGTTTIGDVTGNGSDKYLTSDNNLFDRMSSNSKLMLAEDATATNYLATYFAGETGAHIYEENNLATYIVYVPKAITDNEANDPSTVIGTFYVDVNKNKTPNERCKDIYAFSLKNDGSMAPSDACTTTVVNNKWKLSE